MTHQTETARALLHRHGLPEDIIDGALCLHAQELAAQQRKAHDELRPYSHMGLPCKPEYECGARRVIDLIDPTHAPAAVSAAVAPPTNRAALRDHIAEAMRTAPSFDVRPDWTAPGGPLRITALIDDLADAVLAVLPEPTNQTAVLCATLREVLDTFSPMKDTHDGPVAYYDGSADIEPEQFDRWRAVLDDATRRMADETATEHRPAVSRWRVETLDNLANEWAPGTGWPVRALAVERFDAMNAQAPRWKDGTPVTRRLVRETTTYTVEAEHQPAAGARQDGAQP